MPKKPAETIPTLVKRVAQQSKPKPLTREQLMDQRAAADFAHLAKINSDRSIEYRIMNEPGGRFEPQPSERNAAAGGGTIADLNADMTFARAGARYGHTTFMRSRRVG
jgi:hypothetical protein